jgi:hypothetical protein
MLESAERKVRKEPGNGIVFCAMSLLSSFPSLSFDFLTPQPKEEEEKNKKKKKKSTRRRKRPRCPCKSLAPGDLVH